MLRAIFFPRTELAQENHALVALLTDGLVVRKIPSHLGEMRTPAPWSRGRQAGPGNARAE